MQSPLENTVCHIIYDSFNVCRQVRFTVRYKKPTRRHYYAVRLETSEGYSNLGAKLASLGLSLLRLLRVLRIVK